MKYTLIKICLLIFTLQLTAQESGSEYYPKDEPYPAPVSYANLTEEEAAFIALFEDKNVGNLHVYSSKSASPDVNYFYKGQPVPPALKDILPEKLALLTYLKGSEPHAVASIPGEAEELYLLRIPGGDWDNQISLYAMNGGQLEKLETLAYYDCNARRCLQQDSWLQDVNGDTRLDIITRQRKIRQNNARVKYKTTVLLMQEDGTFRKSRKTDIAEKDYQMHKLR